MINMLTTCLVPRPRYIASVDRFWVTWFEAAVRPTSFPGTLSSRAGAGWIRPEDEVTVRLGYVIKINSP